MKIAARGVPVIKHEGARRTINGAVWFSLLPGVRCKLLGTGLVLTHPDGPPLFVDLETGLACWLSGQWRVTA